MRRMPWSTQCRGGEFRVLRGVVPPGNDNTAAKPGVAVLSEVAVLPPRPPWPPSPPHSTWRRCYVPPYRTRSCRRASETKIRGGGRGPDSWTVDGKTPARQRFGRPRGVDGCGGVLRPVTG